MAPDERTRIELSQQLNERFGPDLAVYLMEVIPPFGWNEIATRTDLKDLETRLALRFDGVRDRIDLKADALEHKLTGEFRHQMNRMLTWLVPVVIAAIVAAAQLD